MSSGNSDEATMNPPRKLSLSLANEKQTTVINFFIKSSPDTVPLGVSSCAIYEEPCDWAE